MKNLDRHPTNSQTWKIPFLKRYIEHLFRCYRNFDDIVKRRDMMFDKVYR